MPMLNLFANQHRPRTPCVYTALSRYSCRDSGTSTLNAQPEDDPSQAYAPTQLTFHVPLPPKLEDPPRSGATLAPAAAPRYTCEGLLAVLAVPALLP
ncbi:hypothetical protein K438DRAFT_1884673 [Mycena galopus ATCC 62051]|nr:hypothetical protein K438DRAFT_1884673 [Mycena galopus ATCC 62051]